MLDMKFELIAQIVFFSSFFGLGWFIFRQMPALIELPDLPKEEGENLIFKLKRRIKELNPFKNFSYENFLQKILMRIRIFTLKTDNQTFNWLRKLREKKKNEENADYWEEIKNFSLRSKNQAFSSTTKIKTDAAGPKILDSLQSSESKIKKDEQNEKGSDADIAQR